MIARLLKEVNFLSFKVTFEFERISWSKNISSSHHLNISFMAVTHSVKGELRNIVSDLRSSHLGSFISLSFCCCFNFHFLIFAFTDIWMKILFQICAAIWVHFCWRQILEPEDVKDLGGIW